MSFTLNKGLFTLDQFTDCHAILGVPVTADANTIRKRYLKLARRLHPDSFVNQDQSYKELATQLFSKLVGPAYNTLCQEQERKEYLLLIQLKGKQAIQENFPVQALGSAAQSLLQSGNLDQLYQETLEALAASQYDDLSRSPEVIGELSELNLVYLMRQSGQRLSTTSSAAPMGTASSASESNVSPANPNAAAAAAQAAMNMGTNPGTRSTTSSVDSYLRRAEESISAKDYRSATLDLRDALRVAPGDSRCHALMGSLYLAQNNLAMARISVKRALELDPKDPRALRDKQRLEKLGQKLDGGTGSTQKAGGARSPGGKKPDQGSGGFLGGLFGGKKK